jgi:hypothetical protein
LDRVEVLLETFRQDSTWVELKKEVVDTSLEEVYAKGNHPVAWEVPHLEDLKEALAMQSIVC